MNGFAFGCLASVMVILLYHLAGPAPAIGLVAFLVVYERTP